MVFTSLERREIFRDAVFLWITPFFAALSMMDFYTLDDVLYSCFRRFVAQAPFFILARTFDRRFMIRQRYKLLLI